MSRRAVVLLLVVLFAAPLLAALALRLAGWTPGDRGNHGVLVDPPVKLKLPLGDGSRLAERWLLVFSPARPCETECRQAFGSLLRVRRGLGRDARRVVVVTAGPVPAPRRGGGAVEATGAAWVGRLGDAVPGGWRPNGAYLVDPRGFVIMRYPPGFDASGLLDDLERLLRYSRVGVQ